MIAALLLACLAIDAPEMQGHCRRGRVCAPGDPEASKAHLAKLIAGKKVRMEIVGRDRYGRALVVASANGVNLSCAQLAAGQAIYVKRWDDGQRVGAVCMALN